MRSVQWTELGNEICAGGVSQRFPCLFKAGASLLASHPSTQDIGGGSLGDDHTSADYVLFYLEGMFNSVHPSVSITNTSGNARILTISSMDTAGVVSAIAL